ncbi:MAG TPA: hypothetical protein VE974_03845 [Thermoanaerobaculia bacterium]|nr:hypothetical protein [Thermoanaerobaculia bacterium]
MKHWIPYLFVLLVASTPLDAAARRRSVRIPSTPWRAPQCEQVTGVPSVGVSLDGGATVLPHAENADDLQVYTFGLAATQRPNQLIAATDRLILETIDAGCSWDLTGFQLPHTGYSFAPGPGGVWAWSRLGPELFRFGVSATEQRTAPMLLPLSFYASPSYPNQLAIADDQRAIWWSDDAGATWEPIANAPGRQPFYAIELAPSVRQHMIAAGLADGAHVTFDGGRIWTRSAGLDGLNVFNIAFSPVAANVIWALGVDPRGTGITRRAIYRSADGGETFTRVLTASAEVDLTSAVDLVPSPQDLGVVYFALPGTTLIALDQSGSVRQRSTLPYRDINAIAFSPAGPEVMYFGLKLSDMTAGPRAE